MTQVISLQNAEDRRELVIDIANRLSQGQLVALPTETVYVVAALSTCPEAVERLQQLCPGGSVIGVKSGGEGRDYVPEASELALRLMRRCWPGPVSLWFRKEWADSGLCSAWPEASVRAVSQDGWLGLWCPAHEFPREVVRHLSSAVLLSGERLSDRPPVRTAEQALGNWGTGLEVVVQDGVCRYGVPATRVGIDESGWKILEPGIIKERTIQRLANRMLLFVCTGNTCRSPMAEGLCRRLLAERLGCAEDDLDEHGYVIASAGVAAVLGGRPSPLAVDVLRLRQVDLTSHASQPISVRLVQQADQIFAMTRGHMEVLLQEYPEAAGRVQLLSRRGRDIADPIGGDLLDYQQCAVQIEEELQSILQEWLPPGGQGAGA